MLYYMELAFLILIPLLYALFMLFEEFLKNQVKIESFCLYISGLVFAYALLIWIRFDMNTMIYQFSLSLDWIYLFYTTPVLIGIDGISILFIQLTALLTWICLFTSIENIKKNMKEYLITFMILETIMFTVFCTLDLLLFFIVFETVLIPMYLVVGYWGYRQRKIHAAYELFLYTLAGSIFMQMGVIDFFLMVGSTSVPLIMMFENKHLLQQLLWLGFFCSFAVKVPMMPVHLWLPEAHVEAPTEGSMILAGILLKLGGYGFARVALTLFLNSNIYYGPILYTFASLSMIYAGLLIFAQIDIKKIIAYSSIVHMNGAILGLFTVNCEGIIGGLLSMITHGVVSGALFYSIGILYKRYNTRLIKYYAGNILQMPVFGMFLFLFMLSNLGFPGSGNFIAEIFVLLALLKANAFLGIIYFSTTLLAVAYTMWLFNRLCFGENYFQPLQANISRSYLCYDVTLTEMHLLSIMMFITFYLGLAPQRSLNTLYFSSKFLSLLHKNI